MKDLSRRVPSWEAMRDAVMDEESRTLRVPMGANASMELAALVAVWERTAGCRGTRWCPGAPEPAVEGLLSVYRHSREHYAKITASLLPVLSMLTAGPLGESLSPEPDFRGMDRDPKDWLNDASIPGGWDPMNPIADGTAGAGEKPHETYTRKVEGLYYEPSGIRPTVGNQANRRRAGGHGRVHVLLRTDLKNR